MQGPEPQDELEAMLAGLPTREPSQMLDARIAETLQQRSDAAVPRLIGVTRSRVLRTLAIAALVLIAAGVSIALLRSNHDKPDSAGNSGKTAPDAFVQRPDDAANQPTPPIIDATYRPQPINLTWTRDRGGQTRYTPTGQPYQAILRDAVDQRTWYEPDTGVTRQILVPSQELIVVKQTTF